MKLRQFINPSQLACIVELCRGEEGEYFVDTLYGVSEVIKSMPKTYDTASQGDEALVSLHYFFGPHHWWIIERDCIDNEQTQAFGFVCLGGDIQNAELGYISIIELLEIGAELDLNWKIRSIGDVKNELLFEGRMAA